MARGRGRGTGRAAHETQDCPYSLRSRRQTTSSRRVSPQLINVPPWGRVNRNRRIPQRERETAEAECSHGSSQPTGKEPVVENIVEDGAPPISTRSPSYCDPSTQKEDAFCDELISRVEGHHRDVDDDVQPSRQNTTGPSPSFNMTEFVRGLLGDSVDEPDEVESAPSVGYEYVHGHKVKTELAGLVGAIFGRYGDIIGESNINEMLDELYLFKTHRLKVEWLLQRLELISETKSNKYLTVKEETEKHCKYNSRIDEDLEQRRKHIVLLEKKISELKQEKEENEATVSALEQTKVENQAKADECTQMAIDIKSRGQALANQSLVHGLL